MPLGRERGIGLDRAAMRMMVVAVLCCLNLAAPSRVDPIKFREVRDFMVSNADPPPNQLGLVSGLAAVIWPHLRYQVTADPKKRQGLMNQLVPAHTVRRFGHRRSGESTSAPVKSWLALTVAQIPSLTPVAASGIRGLMEGTVLPRQLVYSLRRQVVRGGLPPKSPLTVARLGSALIGSRPIKVPSGYMLMCSRVVLQNARWDCALLRRISMM